jgi:hypothetical protein
MKHIHPFKKHSRNRNYSIEHPFLKQPKPGIIVALERPLAMSSSFYTIQISDLPVELTQGKVTPEKTKQEEIFNTLWIHVTMEATLKWDILHFMPKLTISDPQKRRRNTQEAIQSTAIQREPIFFLLG